MNQIVQWEQQEVQVRTLGEPPNQCQPGDVAFVLAGLGKTDASGHWSLDVQPNLCFSGGILAPLSLVATPSFSLKEDQPARPVFVTTEYLENAGFPKIGVRSWRHDGQPAPRVPFAWHLVVLSTFVG